MSFDGFQAWDNHLLNYTGATNYHVVNESTKKLCKKCQADLLAGVPVCSGLSALNQQSSADYKSIQNLYDLAELALVDLQPKAYIFENAPALFTAKGEKVLTTLQEIGYRNGYTSTVVYTNTFLHGIPQNRLRTFFIYWKGDKVPLLNFQNVQPKSLGEYLAEVPKDSPHYKTYPTKGDVRDTTFFKFLLAEFGKDFRKIVVDEKGHHTVMGMCRREPEYLEKLLTFAKDIGDDRVVAYIEHAKNKFSQGKSVWDSSLHLVTDEINAVQGRIFSHTLHPTEDRWINAQEYLYLMGHPIDFKMVDEKNLGMICQNVPVKTAAFWIGEVAKFCRDELPLLEAKFVKHDNVKQTMIVEENENALLVYE